MKRKKEEGGSRSDGVSVPPLTRFCSETLHMSDTYQQQAAVSVDGVSIPHIQGCQNNSCALGCGSHFISQTLFSQQCCLKYEPELPQTPPRFSLCLCCGLEPNSRAKGVSTATLLVLLDISVSLGGSVLLRVSRAV